MIAVWVFLGGGIGAVLRYGVGKAVSACFDGVFPLATLLSNIISCAIFALIAFKYPTSLNTSTKFFLLTGICGGFSTFSTFSFETFELLKNGYWPWAVANVLISVLMCLLILWVVYKTV